jgi:hypothetical protein
MSPSSSARASTIVLFGMIYPLFAMGAQYPVPLAIEYAYQHRWYCKWHVVHNMWKSAYTRQTAPRERTEPLARED